MPTKRTKKTTATDVKKPKLAALENEEILLTQEGYRHVKAELENLRTVVRKRVLDRVREAMGFGEPMENAELEEAKAEQAAVDGRIMELQRLLSSARVIDAAEADGKVHIGTTVRVKDPESGEEFDYHIVGAMEADPAQQRISNQSPVGQALLGRKPGDKVRFSTPQGSSYLIIVSVE
jgi:transcription elongation factor GreA